MRRPPDVNRLRQPLARRLMPLAYALLALVAVLLALTWAALNIQIALAGFLNGESIWSKAQKQAVVALDAYAAEGDPSELADFRRNDRTLQYDRFARDALAREQYDRAEVEAALSHGNAMPEAVPGVIFMLRHLAGAPYVRQALAAWRATDADIEQLEGIADALQAGYRGGTPSPREIARQRARILALNRRIAPYTEVFSQQMAHGAAWLGRVLFAIVLLAALLAALLWMRMARRILAGIRGAEERYRLLFDHAVDAIVMIDDADGRILDVNRTAVRWSGRDEAGLVGDDFASLFEPERDDDGADTSIRRIRGAGAARSVEMQSSLVAWGERTVRQAIIRDVSERVAMEQERRVAAEALASIAEGVIIADAGRRVLSVNRAHVDLTGFTAQALHGQRFDATRTLADEQPLPGWIWDTVAANGHWAGEVLSRRADGGSYPEFLSISAIRDGAGRVQHYVAVFTNIAAAKANRQRLEHLATHDPLTGLVNRSEFERRCNAAIDRAAARRGAVAVLFVDLDNFKIVNDSFSHALGDRMLVMVAQRIRAQLPATASAGRIGGDEFTLLVEDLGTREEAGAVAARVIATLSEPFAIDGHDIVLGASVGIAGYPLDGEDTVALVANADAAMYAAKVEERNAYRFYSPRMHADARRRLLLSAELRQALARDELHLLYQPSVELRSGRAVAVEALVRWNHPERGEILPAEFIPLAERLGLMRGIDEWVLRAACRQLVAWERAGLPPIRVAVNVSATSFGHPAFLRMLTDVLDSQPPPPGRLLLEITESAILGLGDDTDATMLALERLGLDVAIDDFGTGYSSLAYLKLPAVRYLKLDRSFVSGLPASANDIAIVEAMLAMARSLGLQTIAEGVETDAQHDFLVRAGCREGQGFLYARPLSPDAVSELLRRGAARASPLLRLVPPARD